MTYDNIAIPTYLIGSLCNEFENHDEFDIVKTYSNSANQWQLFRNIIEDVGSGHDDDVIVICSEGHQFDETYNKTAFLTDVMESAKLGTQLLVGGCCDFYNLVSISKRLYWVDTFREAHFYVIFRTAFQRILRQELQDNGNIEDVLSNTLPNKLLVYPFVSKIPTECDVHKHLKIYRDIILRYNLSSVNE